ncbi:MAG: hypothetical protein HY400_04900, partial [Elusimicrobia bacterium]|nr:hypothetical protein [Elusimicrobiota bacterium]
MEDYCRFLSIQKEVLKLHFHNIIQWQTIMFLLFCLLLSAVQAQAPSPSVRKINIQQKDVFDPSVPGEDWWVFQMANKIHIQTRPHVIWRELLLKPGGPWDPLKAEESERNLRQFPFLKNARLQSLELSGTNKLDLLVRTQDTWTLEPQLLFSTEGGEESFSAGVVERNLLGLGKTISLFHDETGGDKKHEIRYVDPRVAGSWIRSYALYNETSLSTERQFLAERPFYSLSTVGAFQMHYANLTKEARLFQFAEEFSSFEQRHDFFSGTFGFKINQDPAFPRRLELGYIYQRNE